MYTLFFSSRDKARTFKQAYKGSFKAQIKDNGKEAVSGETLCCSIEQIIEIQSKSLHTSELFCRMSFVATNNVTP